MTSRPVDSVTFEQLLTRASELAAAPQRTVLGIAGAPGAGKSYLAQRIVEALGPKRAALVPMDGFHLADTVLKDQGKLERKGAPDTFDAVGYLRLLQRLRDQPGAKNDRLATADVVYAPQFHRVLDEPIAGAIAVRPDVPLVISEGNYLLVDEPPWSAVGEQFDEVWFLSPPREQRLAQLIARHEFFGRTPEQARERSFGSDQRNAELIADTAHRAARVFRLAGTPA